VADTWAVVATRIGLGYRVRPVKREMFSIFFIHFSMNTEDEIKSRKIARVVIKY
jgi:hypothetical protein